MNIGLIVALVFIAAGSFFLWVVFFKLPMEQEEKENQELMVEQNYQPEDIPDPNAADSVADREATATIDAKKN